MTPFLAASQKLSYHSVLATLDDIKNRADYLTEEPIITCPYCDMMLSMQDEALNTHATNCQNWKQAGRAERRRQRPGNHVKSQQDAVKAMYQRIINDYREADVLAKLPKNMVLDTRALTDTDRCELGEPQSPVSRYSPKWISQVRCDEMMPLDGLP